MSRPKKIARAMKSVMRSAIKPTPVQVNVVPSYRCNLNCSYCYQHSNDGSEMSFKDFQVVVQKAKELHAGYFNFTGGEPSIWDNIVDAIAFLTANNFGSHLTSNGLSLDDRLVEDIGKAELDVLNISLDGIVNLPNSHKTLSRHDAGFTDRLNLLREKYGVRIKINAVITEYSLEQTEEILDYAEKNKFIVSMGLEVPALSESQSNRSRKGLPPRIKEAMSKANKKAVLIEPPEYFENPQFDCNISKQTSLSIDPDLEIVFCYKTRDKPNLKIDQFESQNYQKYLIELKEHIKGCNGSCASNCSYMGNYFRAHPFRLIELLVKSN